MAAKNKSSGSGKSDRHAGLEGVNFVRVFKAFLVVCALGAVVGGIIYLDKLVKQNILAPWQNVPLEVVGIPAWVNDALKERLVAAAMADGKGIRIDEEAAGRVRQNIEAVFPWLEQVRVRTLHDRLRIEGRWRRPVALVKLGLERFYVDRHLVVLGYVPLDGLPIVEVRGLAVLPDRPVPGQPWQREDLAAAVELLALLGKWDAERTPGKPLLGEIAAIDVSNYEGRANKGFPHIVLYTTDDTEVIWGAEVGRWQRHLEATDAEKLAKLYAYYEENGSLLGEVKYINLRDPQDRIHLPIDRY